MISEQENAVTNSGKLDFLDGLEFSTREEYCHLLTSRRRFRRFELQNGDVLGLLDLDSGERFIIHRDTLFAQFAPAV